MRGGVGEIVRAMGRRLPGAAAALFALFVAVHLGALIAMKIPDPSGLFRMYSVEDASGRPYSPPGFAYRDGAGLARGIIELASILAAGALGLMRRRTARLIGALILGLWGLHWVVGMGALFVVGGTSVLEEPVVLLFVGTAIALAFGTLVWAALRVRRVLPVRPGRGR